MTLVSPATSSTPYTYLLTIPHNNTFQNQTNAYVDVNIDRTSPIIVMIRDGNNSDAKNCTRTNSSYSCPFGYTNYNRNRIQLTYVFYVFKNFSENFVLCVL